MDNILFSNLTETDLEINKLNYDIQKQIYLNFKDKTILKSEYAEFLGLTIKEFDKILKFEYDFSNWKLKKIIVVLNRIECKLEVVGISDEDCKYPFTLAKDKAEEFLNQKPDVKQRELMECRAKIVQDKLKY